MRDNTTPLLMPESPATASLKSGVLQPQSTVTKTNHHNTDGDCDGALPKMLSNAHHCTRSCVRPPTSGGLPSTFPDPHMHSPDRTSLSASIAHYICTFASFGGFPITFPRAAGGSTSSSSTRAGGCARHCSSWSRHMFLCFVHHCATDVLLGCRMSCPSLITAITCDVLHRFRQSADKPLFEASVVYSSSSSSSHSVLPRTVCLICPS